MKNINAKVLSKVGRPVSTVKLPKLNLEALRIGAFGPGRPLGSKNKPAPQARKRGRPTKAESIQIMFERISQLISVEG